MDNHNPEPTPTPTCPSHGEVIAALRGALLAAARNAASAEDVRALAELLDSYNAASDWLD